MSSTTHSRASIPTSLASNLEKLTGKPYESLESQEATTMNLDETLAEARPIHGFKWFVTCIAIYLTAFLYGLDTTIAADVQPEIIKSFGAVANLPWIGIGFPLGSVAVILPVGYAFGTFQIKTIYLASIVLFEVGSALCGAAPTMQVFIIGRVIAGAGGAGTYLGVLNYLSVFTSIQERNMYNSLIGMVWGLGTILGPIVGGGFAVSSATWRWAFYINLVLAAMMAPAFVLLLPKHQPQPDQDLMWKLRRMDWLGIALIAGVYTTFTLAFNFGGSVWLWHDYRFILTVAVFGAILAGFVVTQTFSITTTPDRRVFPGHFLKSRTMVLVFVTTSALNCALFIGTYYIPLFFQFAHGDSAMMSAVRLLPFICVSITFILLNGALMPRFGYYGLWYVFAGCMTCIGGGLMYGIDSGTSANTIYGYSILVAVGAGSSLQAGYAIVAAKVKPEDVPAAIGFINVAQVGSMVIGLTISGSIFQNVAFANLKTALATMGFQNQEIRDAISGTQSAIFRSGSEDVRQAAVRAIVGAMDGVFLLLVVAGGVTLVAALLMRKERLFVTSPSDSEK